MSKKVKKIDHRGDDKVYRRLLTYLRSYWQWVLAAFLLNGLYSIIDSSLVYSMKPILDKGFNSNNHLYIVYVPLFLLTAFIFRGLSNISGSYAMAYASRSVVMNMRRQMFDHLLVLPANYYHKHSSGETLSAIIFNVAQVSNASATALTNLAQSGFFVIGLTVVMFSISWKLSLLFIVIAPIMAYIVRYSSRQMRHISHGVQDVMAEVSSTAEEAISGYRVIRAFGGQEYERNKFYQSTYRHRRKELSTVLVKTISVFGVQFLMGMAIVFIVFLAMSHHVGLTAGGFAALVAAALAIIKPLKTITQVNATLQEGLAGAQSVFSFLDQQIENDHHQSQLPRATGRISYQSVCFSYHPDLSGSDSSSQSVLKNINLDVAPGKMLALVGHSGAGKSSLVNLLPRFYDGYQGRIFIDGIDTRELSLKNLRQQMALVSQDVVLFNDTIAHNIAYGCFDDSDEQKIITAAKMAHAWEFIEKLPMGLQALIGEDGVLLSGGQRQRLAIARAIFKAAPILILDEATASLDSKSEQYIQQALENLMQDCTTLVIAHRLSTIQRADQIIVMDNGQIVEQGTHQQLLALSGYYTRLYNIQFHQHLADHDNE